MTKEKKLKVPKRIAGVKVPKKARKTANKALALAENPMTRQIAIAALTAAAAALSQKKVETRAAVAEGDGEAGKQAREVKLADLVIAAALQGARRLMEDKPAAPAPAPEAAAEAPKRKRISSPNGSGTDPV